MKFSVCFLLFIFLFLDRKPILAQQNQEFSIELSGTIVDAKTSLPLAYVNIGIVDKSIGTVSDLAGKFKFSIGSENLEDIVQFSMIGYETQKISVQDYRESRHDSLFLDPKDYLLDELVVVNKQNQEIVGREKGGGLIQFAMHPKDGIKMGTEFAMKIEAKHYPAILKDFNFFFTNNTFNRIKLRVNIYTLKNNVPDTLINKNAIYIDVIDEQSGWHVVDLSKFNIIVNSDFVISLQWVEHVLKNDAHNVFIPGDFSFSKTSYFRIASQDKWKKSKASLCYYVTLNYSD